MDKHCPVCSSRLKVKTEYERGYILEEKRTCTHCGYEYYEYQGMAEDNLEEIVKKY